MTEAYSEPSFAASTALIPLSVSRETFDKLMRNPVSRVRWVPRTKVVANSWNPNSVAVNEMRLLKTSVMADGYTQPIVTVRDESRDTWIVVDGFHRNVTGQDLDVIAKWTDGYLPVVELTETSIADLMASTVRHNRARGKHSVAGMSSLVLQMLDEGHTEDEVMAELGLTVDEITRYKYTSGFAKLFESAVYKRGWMTRRQIALRKQWMADHPGEEVPEI